MASITEHFQRIENATRNVAAHAAFGACGEAFGLLVADRGAIVPELNKVLSTMLDRPRFSPRELAVQWRSDGAKLATQYSVAVRKAFSLVISIQHATSRNVF